MQLHQPLLLIKPAIEKRIMDGLSILKRHDPKNARASTFLGLDFAPEANTSITLYLLPDWRCKNLRTPFTLYIGSLT
jgi:hypothetical protein